jgi:DNA-binding CsgD family transcriptional regulator
MKEFSPKEDFKVLLRAVEVRSSPDSSVIYNPAFIVNKEISRSQSIKFQYAAPFFDGFEDLKYSYRLLPIDEHWSQWTPMSEKEFPYLPAGSYSFEVRALNVYGTQSSVSTFSFKVLKPWYSSDIAIAAYFMGGLIIIFIVLLIQRNKHRAEKSLLKESKELALKEKNEEIDQISLESKKEIDRLLTEKLKTEIDLKNDQLTTITMHLMNNNQAIKDALRKIEANLDESGSKEELKDILKDIDKNISNKNSWDQFAYHFDQVHGDYLKKLSENNVTLSPREIKLAAFLRMNMSSKEISKMMNITERSVELARYRLRKKLKLERDQNLVEYLIELDNQ